MSAEKKLKAEADAEKATPVKPKLQDHRDSANPYFSKYGKEDWKAQVLNHSKMKRIVN